MHSIGWDNLMESPLCQKELLTHQGLKPTSDPLLAHSYSPISPVASRYKGGLYDLISSDIVQSHKDSDRLYYNNSGDIAMSLCICSRVRRLRQACIIWPQGWDVLITLPYQYLSTSFQTLEVPLGGPPQKGNEEAIGDRPLVVCPNVEDHSYSPQQLASQHRLVVAQKAITEEPREAPTKMSVGGGCIP